MNRDRHEGNYHVRRARKDSAAAQAYRAPYRMYSPAMARCHAGAGICIWKLVIEGNSMRDYEEYFITLCLEFQDTKEYVKNLDEAWKECLFQQSRYGDGNVIDNCVIQELCNLLSNDFFLKSHASEKIIGMINWCFEDDLLPSQIQRFRECFCEIYNKVADNKDGVSYLEILMFIIRSGDENSNLKIIEGFLRNTTDVALIMIPWGLSYLHRYSVTDMVKNRCKELLKELCSSENAELAREASMHFRIVSARENRLVR